MANGTFGTWYNYNLRDGHIFFINYGDLVMFLDMIIMMNDDKNVITIYILYFTHVTLSINVLSLKSFAPFTRPWVYQLLKLDNLNPLHLPESEASELLYHCILSEDECQSLDWLISYFLHVSFLVHVSFQDHVSRQHTCQLHCQPDKNVIIQLKQNALF